MKMNKLQLLVPVAVILWLAGCSPEQEQGAGPDSGADVTAAGDGLGAGIDRENFDPTIDPGDDFYRFVNGDWLARTEIPSDRSNYGAFTVLVEEAEENLRAIIEEAAESDAPANSAARKVGDFFQSFMDVETIESRGRAPLREPLERIAGAAGKAELAGVMADLNRVSVQMPVGLYINADAMQSDQYITYINQSGLGLPDRDWYLEQDNPRYQRAREAYRAYMNEVMELAGYERAERVADSVFAIENRIAEAHWDRVRNRQRELTYNKMTLDEVEQMAPRIQWRRLLNGLGIDETTFIVRQPGYLEALSGLWNEISLEQWKDYASFRAVDAYADYLSEDFVRARFDFRGRVLNGLEEMRPRWKRGVDAVDRALGEVLGRLYVERHFQEAAKDRMDELVANLMEAFRLGIDELDWMTEATKEEAHDKLARFTTKIGYPEEWKDYSALEVRPDDLVGNLMRSSEVEHNREVEKLGEPVDRSEWFMTPHTVNAYYNPTMNEIVFPAAILQPPFFNVDADDAVNYGAIGAVIGHEISHGFDDQGRKSDGDGNLRDWWTEEDAEAFDARARQLVDQYEQFEVLPGRNLNGEFTLGENIGDISGLAVAYRAYRLSLNGGEAPVIDDLTGDQRFFIGWAQVWRRLYRDEDLEMRLTNDPHAHSEARSNGVVRNLDAWYEAFDVTPDNALYLPPEERVRIW